MSFVGFLGDHVCTTRELILGREGGQCCIPARSSRETVAVSRVLPRHAASTREALYNPSWILHSDLRPSEPSTLMPVASTGGGAAGYAKKPGDGRLPRPTARLDGRGQSSCGCVAPLSAGLPRPWGAVPGQPRSSALWPVYKTIVTPRLYFRILLAVKRSPSSTGRTLLWNQENEGEESEREWESERQSE